ncbi:MAG: hypothetical protein AAF125_07475 [Chloroflexota bacterium]
MSEMEFEIGSISGFNNDNSDTIVMVYWQGDDDGVWESESRNFDRVPIVGEYLTFSREADWYEVVAVVHMAFPLDYDAEVYCKMVEDKIALRQSFGK